MPQPYWRPRGAQRGRPGHGGGAGSPHGANPVRVMGSTADRACEVAERESAKQRNQAALDRGVEPSIFETRLATTTRRRGDDLHVCPSCKSELVYPTDWAPASNRHWHVALRCPECEWNGGGSSTPD